MLDTDSKLKKKELHKLTQACDTTAVSEGLNSDADVMRMGSHLPDHGAGCGQRQERALMPPRLSLKVSFPPTGREGASYKRARPAARGTHCALPDAALCATDSRGTAARTGAGGSPR